MPGSMTCSARRTSRTPPPPQPLTPLSSPAAGSVLLPHLLYDDDDLRFFPDYPIQLAADFMGVSVKLAEYRLTEILY